MINFLSKLFRSTKWFIRMFNNHEFDHSYCVRTLKWKLEDMLKFFSSDDAIGGEADKKKDEIEHAIYYLEVALENEYMDRFLNPLYTDYNCDVCAWRFEERNKEGIHNGKKVYFYHTPSKCTFCHTHGMDKEFYYKNFLRKQEDAHQKDVRAFFLYLAENFECWWD